MKSKEKSKMTEKELQELLLKIQKTKCETQNLEIKRAERDCPKHLYDTLSSFSNQESGGTIIFGVSEQDGFKEVGVYDPHDLQKRINEQCRQMDPIVRPLLTVAEKNDKFFVSAEIPGMDVSLRPCFYRGKGIVKGSYMRIGDSDEQMTEYEVYSYEAFRKKYQDDIRTIPRVTFSSLDKTKLENYIIKLKSNKPRLAILDSETIYELMSITRNQEITLASMMLFSPYPQAYMPQLCIIALSLPGTEKGNIGETGERFIDNERIEGTIPEMLEDALSFVKKNMKTKTTIDEKTGERKDETEYPIAAIREVILNALVHRDYSIYTEGMPITLDMYEDRIEISNPGGLYGRINIEQLGKSKPDTRNPIIVTALETMGISENRYSGIPTIRNELRKNGLQDPEFIDKRGHFTVIFYKKKITVKEHIKDQESFEDFKDMDLIEYCKEPKSRKEIASFLHIGTVSYAIKTYVHPLVEQGVLELTIPEKPSSHKQKYKTVEK